MKIGNINVQIGGFHDHWLRNGTDTASVLIAAVSKYHYDFICLMDEEYKEKAGQIKRQLESWIPGFRAYIGEERAYGWGHVVTVMNEYNDYNLQNNDFFDELRKTKEHGGITALAHIGHPVSKEKIAKAGHIDHLIDGGYVDAIQIEREDDWQWIRERAENGKLIPLISGWDSHMLTPFYGMPNCLYDKNFGVKEHFEGPPLVRTIVFSEDNSLEKLKEALNNGMSVMEDMENERIYGSPKLIELLEKNGYHEKMEELDRKYNERNIKSDVLHVGEQQSIKFPGRGMVYYAKNEKLEIEKCKTPDSGIFEYRNVPMPVEQDDSYLPIMFDDGEYKRFWAIKVENEIIIDITPDIKEDERLLRLIAKKPFSGKIVFDAPFSKEYTVFAEENEVLLEIKIDETVPEIFDCSFVAEKSNGVKRHYKKHLAVAKVRRWHGSWNNAEDIIVEDSRFCGGFGSFREYPGKDVFSFRAKLLWDEKYLYLKYDITDKIYVAPKPGAFMYLADCTFLTLDTLYARTNNIDATGGITIGFPDENGEILIDNPTYPDGTHYFKRDSNFKSKSELHMEMTSRGRIVTAKIPWNELSPKPVKCGDRMGILISAVNNEGAGLVDNMQWPWAPENGTWLFPCNFGTMVLSE